MGEGIGGHDSLAEARLRHNVVGQVEHACVIKDYSEPDSSQRYKAVFSV